MIINYLVLPTPADIRAARNFLHWTQTEFAYKCGLNMTAITGIENEKQKPTKKHLEDMARVFFQESILFNEGGGFRVDKNAVTVYAGRNCYIEMQTDILRTCGPTKDEVLYLGADDRKSTEESEVLEARMFEIGIPCKKLISEDNNYVLGPLENYRSTNGRYFLSDDIVVIYDSKVCFSIGPSENKDQHKIIRISDKFFAEKFRKLFHDLWENSSEIKKSSTEQKWFYGEKEPTQPASKK